MQAKHAYTLNTLKSFRTVGVSTIGTGEMTQWPRVPANLVEDRSSVPRTPSDGSQLPVTPFPGHPIPSSGLFGYPDTRSIHSHKHTDIHILNK